MDKSSFNVLFTPLFILIICWSVESYGQPLQCNNCFVFEVYYDATDPGFKPYRIIMDSVGVYRKTVYRQNTEHDLDYYLDKVPKVIRDLAPMKAMRLAKELQNSERGRYQSPEEQIANRLKDNFYEIKTNQFFINKKLDEVTRRQQYGL